MSAAGALWALIVASVITAGLNDTCQAYRDSSNNYDNLPYASGANFESPFHKLFSFPSVAVSSITHLLN